MIGLLLLVIALVCYFKTRYRWFSYFLYVSFMLGYSGGFGLWTDRVTGIKNGDLAVVYTLVISVYLMMTKNYKLPQLSFIKQYKWAVIFLVCSMLFSFIHYEVSPYYILQGSRGYLLLFALPILCSIKGNEFDRLMRAIMWITAFTSVLYILQIIVGHPIMPYGDGTVNSYKMDRTTGFVRLYNSPPLKVFFLSLSFVYPQYFGKKVNLFRIIFFMSLMCTLGRTGIFAGMLTVFLSVLFCGKTGRLIKMAFFLGLLFLPFMDMIGNRFEKGGTKDDIQSLLKGNAMYYENSGDGGTMTYRIAWVLERSLYLAERPVGEMIFGLGLITDSYPKVYQMYRFRLGIVNRETDEVYQMSTPDISYGNLISKWGFGGTIIYLLFVIYMIAYLFRHRKDNPFATVAAASIAMLLFSSISNSSLSEPNNFVIYYIVISSLICKGKILSSTEKNILNRQQ